MYVNTFWKIRIVSDFCSLPFVTRCIWVSWSKHKRLHDIPLFWVHPDLLNLSSLGSFRLCTVADNSSNISGSIFTLAQIREWDLWVEVYVCYYLDRYCHWPSKNFFLAYAYTSSVWKLSVLMSAPSILGF